MGYLFYMDKKYTTLLSLLYKNYLDTPDKKWLFSYENESYKGYSYHEILSDVIAMYLQFKSAGIKKNDQVAIFAYNSRQWAIVDFALMMLEAVTVPFYHGLIGSELNKYLELVEIKMACVNTLEQYHLLKNLPEDKQITGPIVVFNENTQILDTDFHYSDFLKMGRERLDGEIIDYEDIFMGGDENHIITLMFSSGDKLPIFFSHFKSAPA